MLAFHALGQFQRQYKAADTKGRVEATLHPDLPLFAAFVMQTRGKGLKDSSPELDPALFESSETLTDSPNELKIIDSDIDDVATKLELYMQRVIQYFYETERSPFAKATLGQTIRLVETGVADTLISKVLELWVATNILADPAREWWLLVNPTQASPATPIAISLEELKAEAGSTSLDAPDRSLSYELIIHQIRGAAEKRAANLAKFIMNDLERRLLQRQQAKPFETFLVAVMLLLCVERMCWLFGQWESREPPYPYNNNNFSSVRSEERVPETGYQSHEQHPASDPLGITTEMQGHPAEHGPPSLAPLTTSYPSKWPLDRIPTIYVAQGDRFSDILVMLLKMRGIPPKALIRDTDGMLTASPPNGPSVNKDDWDNVNQWYHDIGVSVQMLRDARDSANVIHFEGRDVREWELRFVQKLLVIGLVNGSI